MARSGENHVLLTFLALSTPTSPTPRHHDMQYGTAQGNCLLLNRLQMQFHYMLTSRKSLKLEHFADGFYQQQLLLTIEFDRIYELKLFGN